MSGQLWLLQQASVPAPSEVAAYLLQQGWLLQDSNAQWAVFQKTLGETTFTLEVPQQAAAIDYPRAVGILLDDLARVESRPPAVVLRDLKSSSVDSIRLAIDSAVTRDGRQVRFSGDTAPILREAAARLREKATYPDTEVVGPVVKLNSIDPAQGGDAVLQTEIDGRLRSVKIVLDPATYTQAIEAHQKRQWIRCTGELVREGSSMALRNARDVAVLADTEEI